MKNIQNIDLKKTDKISDSEIGLWFNKVETFSKFSPRNLDIGMESILQAKQMDLPLPLILTFCPAIENLGVSGTHDKTRKLIPLSKNLERARLTIEEMFGLALSLKKELGLESTFFLIFEDDLEKGTEQTIINANEVKQISEESLGGIKELFLDFDQTHQGFLQTHHLEIPKVRRQSTLNVEAGKTGASRKDLIERAETKMFDPLNPLFSLWEKHLLLTRKDTSFVSTGWQNKKGSEMLWERVRSRLAEFVADGELLPKMAKSMNPKKFSKAMPKPIFISSSTREGGFVMEADGFNVPMPVCVISPFHNIGRWTKEVSNSPWILETKTDIIK